MIISLFCKGKPVPAFNRFDPDDFLVMLLRQQKAHTTRLEDIYIKQMLLTNPEARQLMQEVQETFPYDSWQQPRNRKAELFITITALALVTIVTVSYWLHYQHATPRWNIININNGNKGIIDLPDGSSVTLNAGSTLKVSGDYAHKREMHLNGEAFFKIIRDSSHPIIVHTDKAAIYSAGSNFNLNTYDSSFSAFLLEGDAVITTTTGKQIPLGTGMSLVYLAHNRQWRLAPLKADSIPGWIDGGYHFSKKTLQETCKLLERVYGTPILFDHTPTTALLSGYFNRKDSLKAVLEKLSVTSNMQYTFDGQGIIHWR